MTDEQQPELRWAPLPPKPSNTGRIWLIVGLTVAALAIIGVLLFLFLPRGDTPDPAASSTPSPSASPTESSAPTPSPTPTDATPQPPVQTEAPPVVDPSVEAFRTRVGPPLQDAAQGLDIVAGSSSQDAASVVDTLQQDAQRMADTPPPSSISAAWSDGLIAYSQRLTDLRTALAGGSSSAVALQDARAALQSLNDLVGL